MKSALLILNGSEPKNLPCSSKFDIVCAVDGAYNQLKKMNVVPDIITGDFDSLDEKPHAIELINTPNQEYTDFEKALQILFDREIMQVSIYGGSGNESDHFLGNLSVALAWKEKLTIQFFDEFGSFYFIPKRFEISKVASKIVSLIPFPSATEITTSGLEFPLQGENLSFGNRIGTRNRAISDNITIEFKEGNLLIYISNKA